MRTFALAAFVCLAGCRDGEPVSDAPSQKPRHAFRPESIKIMQPTPGQRFTPTSSSLVAFDTATGTLCATYEWQESYRQEGLVACDAIQAKFPDQR